MDTQIGYNLAGGGTVIFPPSNKGATAGGNCLIFCPKMRNYNQLWLGDGGQGGAKKGIIADSYNTTPPDQGRGTATMLIKLIDNAYFYYIILCY